MAKNFDKFRKISSVQIPQRTKFKSKDVPSRHVILYNYNKLENTGSINHLPRSEPIPNETRQNAKIAIEELIKENTSLSIRKLSVAAQILYGTTN